MMSSFSLPFQVHASFPHLLSGIKKYTIKQENCEIYNQKYTDIVVSEIFEGVDISSLSLITIFLENNRVEQSAPTVAHPAISRVGVSSFKQRRSST